MQVNGQETFGWVLNKYLTLLPFSEMIQKGHFSIFGPHIQGQRMRGQERVSPGFDDRLSFWDNEHGEVHPFIFIIFLEFQDS